MRSLLACWLLIALFSVVKGNWEIVVDPYTEECFIEDITTPGTTIGVIFQVTDGGALDIDLRVTAQSGRMVYNEQRKTEGRFWFTATEIGRHSICFSNHMSTVTHKVVDFDILRSAQEEEPSLVGPQDWTKLDDLLKQVLDSSNMIKTEIDYAIMREKAHRKTSEHINSTVVWWNIFEIAILLAMAAWQIFYLRRFFEVKRPI